MADIGNNIRFLRKHNGLTQEELAEKLGIKRSLIGSYEENRATPKLPVIQTIANFFSIKLEHLINEELNNANIEDVKSNKLKQEFKILSISVDNDNKELITTVPVKASAGYTNGYSDPEFIKDLPHFSLPFTELSQEKTYRVFQINGDSMNPIKSGSYIICEYLTNPDEFTNGKTYIVITKEEGIVYKRLYSHAEQYDKIVLKSDNIEYKPYLLKKEDILEIWQALGYVSFDLPGNTVNTEVNKLYDLIFELKDEIKKLKK